MAAYAASKSGLQRLLESLSQEVRARGIHVNSIAPTIMDPPANRAEMPDADRSVWVPSKWRRRASASWPRRLLRRSTHSTWCWEREPIGTVLGVPQAGCSVRRLCRMSRH